LIVQVRPTGGPEIVNKEIRRLFFVPSVDGRAVFKIIEVQIGGGE